MSNRRKLKGILHSHTGLSHDGTLTPEELRTFFMSRGFDFLCVSDHSQDLTPEVFLELKEKLRELSDDKFAFIPGIEYSTNGGAHILGIGIEEIITEDDQNSVIDHIHKSGGIAIWAHPTKTNYPTDPSWLARLDGVEIWNLANDGKFLPQKKSIDKYYELKRINSGLLAFFGMDFHRMEKYFDLSLEIPQGECREKSILEYLKTGNYICHSDTISLTSNPQIGGAKRMIFAILRGILNIVRAFRNRVTGEQRKA